MGSVEFDKECNALYVSISDETIVKTEEIYEDILFVDFDNKGKIVGIEILLPPSTNINFLPRKIVDNGN